MIRRRKFITLLGGAAAWPLAARLVSFRRGLADVGYAEGRNVAIEYRFTDGRYDPLPAQLTDLTQRKVGVIVLSVVLIERVLQQIRASPIPIVMTYGTDPVRLGLAVSMNRPGGNVTGVTSLVAELSGKQLGLLRDLVPKAATVAALFDASQISEDRNRFGLRDARDATAALGQKLLVLGASTAEEIDAQFAKLNKEPADAMIVLTNPFFSRGGSRSRRSRHAIAFPQSTDGASTPKLAAS